MQGRLFSGPLDRVRALEPVRAVARARAPAGVAKQDQPWLAAVLAGQADEAGLPQQQAASAYAQTAAAPRQPLSRVQQVMSRRPITVPLAASVHEAWRLLDNAGVGQAPVLDASGRLVGLIMRADLLRPDSLPLDPADAAAWAARLAEPVAQAMWTPVPSALPETPLREVAQLLLDLRLPGLPVLDDQGALQGFLSRSDLLRALTREPPLDLWT